jgi:hypothetical protein
VANAGALVILFFMFGIGRSWQLVGARSVSLATAVTAAIQRPSPGHADAGDLGGPAAAGDSGVAADEKPAAGGQ